jgi:hypothetical protein
MGNLPVLLQRLLLMCMHWFGLDFAATKSRVASVLTDGLAMEQTSQLAHWRLGGLFSRSMAALLVVAGLLNLAPPAALAQQANLGACNTNSMVPFVNGSTPAFSVTQTNSTGGAGSWTPLFGSNTSPLAIDNNLTNSAQLNITLGGSGKLRVGDATNTYSAGNFAGFRISVGSLAVATLTIRTFNNGVQQESKNIPVQGGTFNAGFITTLPYDAIEVEYGLVGLTGGMTVFYAVNSPYCAGPALPECNSAVAMNSPVYPVEVVGQTEGVLPIGSGVSNASAVISTASGDFATLNLGTGAAVLYVKDLITTYPAGTFAGFDVKNIDFVNDKFGGLTITTLLGGVQQEASGVFNVLVLASSEQSLVSFGVDPTGRQTVGFVTTKPFDEIKIAYAKVDIPFSNNEHPTEVYSAILDNRCGVGTLACNELKDFNFPTYPASEYSGQIGGCLSTMFGQGALVSADTSDFVGIIDGVAVGCSQYVGVRNSRVGDTYPAGTYAGFELMQLGVVSISVADFGTITTYLNGAVVESSTSANLIASSFVVGKKQFVGFKTTQPFDEVRYSRLGLISASVTTTRVYRAVIEKVCPVPLTACNTLTTLNRPERSLVTASYTAPYLGVIGCSATNTGEEALITANPNDFALMTLVQANQCFRWVSVKDQGTVYPAGTYAGVDLEYTSLVAVQVGDFQYVKTYLNGVFQEQRARGSLTTLSALTGGRQVFGFNTTLPFDEIRYEEYTVFTPLTTSSTRVYGMVVEKFCDGAPLTCTTPNNVPGLETDFVRLNSPASATATNTGWPMTLSGNPNAGFLGIAACTNQLTGLQNAISADVNDYAEIALTGINCTASIDFEINSQTIAAGTWAGVEVENTTAANLDLINGVTVQTYLNGALQESRTAAGLLDVSIGASTKKKLGFVTSKPFNKIVYIQGSLIGAALGTTKVYGALLRELCAAPALTCNEKKILSMPEYPISTNSIVGGACISGVANADAIGTPDPNDYAYFTLGLNILCDRAVAVRDWKTTYPAGTYAGFDVQFDAIVEVALNDYKIQTYLNGVMQEEVDADFALSYGLYAGSVRFPVGFKTTQPFNEVRFVLKSLAAASGTGVRVYDSFLMNLCQPTTVACNQTYELRPSATGSPIVIDGTKSGITGACAGCFISNAENLLTTTPTDYAEISMLTGLGNEAKIAVLNPLHSYPAGTRVGFTYQNQNTIFDASLFSNTKIRTFLNGVQQQEITGQGNLIEFPIITSWNTPSIKNIGFTATQPFDEVQIAFTNLTGSLQVYRVYGAFVDTQTSSGTFGTTPLSCSCASGTVSPAMTTTALANTCPATTVDLNTAFAGTAPVGTSLVWATTPTPTTATALSSTATVSGTYYGFFYDATNQCFSPASTSVVVSITACSPTSFTLANSNPATQTAVQGAMMTGNAASLLNPSGGTAPYTYAAFNPATPGTTGLTIPTAHGSVTINPTTGAYTYTPNPGYSGSDSFGLRVCDSSPTPNCQNVTVPVTVLAVNTNCNVPNATITK